eukprot:6182694-Pleurochrysis_carterae.AAC.2
MSTDESRYESVCAATQATNTSFFLRRKKQECFPVRKYKRKYKHVVFPFRSTKESASLSAAFCECYPFRSKRHESRSACVQQKESLDAEEKDGAAARGCVCVCAES